MKMLGVKRYFDKYAKEYLLQERQKFKWYTWMTGEIIKAVSPRRGHKIVDLGTGTGFLAVKLSKIVGEEGSVVGVDISGKMIQEAERIADRLQLKNVRFSVCRIEDISFPDDNFDSVVSNIALDHVKGKEAVLRKVHACLKEGGRFATGQWFDAEPEHLKAVESLRKRNQRKAREFDENWESFVRSGKVSEGYYRQHPKEYGVGVLEMKRLMEKSGFVDVKITESYKPEIAVVAGTKR